MSLRPALAALAVALVAAAVPSCGAGSVEDAPVVLRDVHDAFVLAGGTERPASDGEKLAKNEVVRTRDGGTATLVVRDRKVVLAGDTAVLVPDGATVDVQRGAVLVDRRRGPGLTVRVADTTIDEIGNGALRVERSYTVLVAGLSAGARIRTITGAALDLPPLYQVVAPGRGLARAALPLQLRSDDWERAIIPAVVADDERLTDLARGLDAPGPPVVPVAYRTSRRPSDLLLADAIGRAAARDEPTRRSAASRARLLRAEGGSWGVVAHLLDTTAIDVGSALAEVLRGVPATSGDPVTPGPTTPGAVAGGSPQPGVTPTPGPTSGPPGPTRPPGTTRPPSSPPTTSSSPTESPDPLDELVSSIPTPPIELPPILP